VQKGTNLFIVKLLIETGRYKSRRFRGWDHGRDYKTRLGNMRLRRLLFVISSGKETV
jgi:hypothetical protein